MKSAELSAAVGVMSFEELAAQVAPLVGKYSRWRVPGYEPEDIRQELHVVLWRCHASYDRSKGQFLTLLIRSFENTMGKLAAKSRRQAQPLAALVCAAGCDVRIAPRARGGACPACGGGRWVAVRSALNLLSLDDEDKETGLTRIQASGSPSTEGAERVRAACEAVAVAAARRSVARSYPEIYARARAGTLTAEDRSTVLSALIGGYDQRVEA